MSTTSAFIVAALGGCALGLSACAATDGTPSDMPTTKPRLHRIATTAGAGLPPAAPTWRQGLPSRPARLPLPALPGFEQTSKSYKVQLPELPVRVTPEIVATWTGPARIKLLPLRPRRELASESIERTPLARR